MSTKNKSRGTKVNQNTSRKKTVQNKGNSNKGNSNKGSWNKSGDIKGVVFIAIGIILSLAIYTNLIGTLSVMAQNIARFLIGIGGYAIPIYVLYLGYEYIKGKGSVELNRNFIGVTIYVIIFILISSTIYLSGVQNLSFSKGFNSIVKSAGGIDGGGILSTNNDRPYFRLSYHKSLNIALSLFQ